MIERRGVSISAETVRFDADKMWVGLSDGRVIGVPLAWFPRLARATPAEREGFEISPFGIHWEALDEDLGRGPARRARGSRAGRGRGGVRKWWVDDPLLDLLNRLAADRLAVMSIDKCTEPG